MVATQVPFDEATRSGDPLIGAQLGEYKVLSLLGQGAMGVVYRGEQPVIGKPVAIKVLQSALSADPGYVKKLLEEARAISAARHPNIIDIFSFGQAPTGQQYFVMECLDGDPLDVHLAEQKRLSPEETARLLQQVTAGLSAAHAAGVIHRDLKPSNIFLARLGDGTRFVKLLDFGLAKRTAPNSGVRPTANVIVGTALYMAPEQATGEEVGPWTDLYAVGCIAHELLTGQPPFPGTHIIEVLNAHASQAPPPLRQFDPTIPEEFEALVLELLQKSPAKRPKSAAQVRKSLERIERHLATQRTRGTGIQAMSLADALAPPRRSPATGDSGTVPMARALEVGPTHISQPRLKQVGERPTAPEAFAATKISTRLTEAEIEAAEDERDFPTHPSAPEAGPVPRGRADGRGSATQPAQDRLPRSRVWVALVLAPVLGIGGFFVAKTLDKTEAVVSAPPPSADTPAAVAPAPLPPVVAPAPPVAPVAEPARVKSPAPPSATATPPRPTKRLRPDHTKAALANRIADYRKRCQASFKEGPDLRIPERRLDALTAALEQETKSLDEVSKELDEFYAFTLQPK